MSFIPFTKLATVAMVLIAEPDAGRINFLFSFEFKQLKAALEMSEYVSRMPSMWRNLTPGQYVFLEVEQFECEKGSALANAPAPYYEIATEAFICSANPNAVHINGASNEPSSRF